MKTSTGMKIPNRMFYNYLSALIDQFFKILPLKESGEPSLKEYMRSLQLEMIGNKQLIVAIHDDAMYLKLLAILQYMIENDCETNVVKREVFKSISICKKLQEKYFGKEVDSNGHVGHI